MALQFTGLGSLMNLHATDAPIRRGADAAQADQRVRDLFFFHMLEHGVYVARRGFIVLSLPLDDSHISRFVAAFESFVRDHAPLLGVRAR